MLYTEVLTNIDKQHIGVPFIIDAIAPANVRDRLRHPLLIQSDLLGSTWGVVRNIQKTRGCVTYTQTQADKAVLTRNFEADLERCHEGPCHYAQNGRDCPMLARKRLARRR